MTETRKPDAELTEAEILKRYKPFVYQQTKRFAKQGAEIEDLMQEASIALIKSFRQWSPDGGASLLTWIHNPVRYALIKCAKARKKQSVESASMDAPFQRPFDGSNDNFLITLHDIIGEDFKYPEDVEENLKKEIRKLPKRERGILILILEGKTQKEIGDIEGISRSRIGQVIEEALKLLKYRMGRHLRAV